MNIFLGIDIGGSSFKYGLGNCEVGLQYYQILNLPEKNLNTFLSVASKMFNDVAGFDGICETQGACRGAVGLVKSRKK